MCYCQEEGKITLRGWGEPKEQAVQPVPAETEFNSAKTPSRLGMMQNFSFEQKTSAAKASVD